MCTPLVSQPGKPVLREERYGFLKYIEYRFGRYEIGRPLPTLDAGREVASMVARNPHSAPRAVGGGRSPRYDKRAHRAGASKAYAPEWSDAAAAAVMAALQETRV